MPEQSKRIFCVLMGGMLPPFFSQSTWEGYFVRGQLSFSIQRRFCETEASSLDSLPPCDPFVTLAEMCLNKSLSPLPSPFFLSVLLHPAVKSQSSVCRLHVMSQSQPCDFTCRLKPKVQTGLAEEGRKKIEPPPLPIPPFVIKPVAEINRKGVGRSSRKKG